MLERLDETIVAISSAPGYGAVGIVRLCGARAIAIVDRMASVDTHEPLAARPGSTRVTGEVHVDEATSLPAVFYLFRAPRSYTRQDIVEIQTVGSPPALELVRRRAMELGALQAGPGEFTARAFLNGAMDLASAEAVAGVIRAQTDTQLRASRRMMDGMLGKRMTELRNELAELLGLVEADIDFAEEPIEFITPDKLRSRLLRMAARLDELLQGATSVERFDLLPHVLLFGPPNAGKSSLMNRLSGTRRSICEAAAGTTRDILSAPMRLRRGEAILLDTAGMDRSEDEIIAQARARTLSAAERVDLVCVVVDMTAADDEHIFETVHSLDIGAIVVAANKCDLVSAEEAGEMVERLRRRCSSASSMKVGRPIAPLLTKEGLGEVVDRSNDPPQSPLGKGEGKATNLCGNDSRAVAQSPVCPVSALEGTGIDVLRDAIADGLGSTVTTALGESVLISERQGTAIKDAFEALQRAMSLCEAAQETIDCADLLAFELREALDVLGAVTGGVTTEDMLGRVFADFCIGK